MNIMPPPKVYRFEPREDKGQTWEQYINFACTYFKLSVAIRTKAVADFKKYTDDGVCKHCAGYSILRETGLWDLMKKDVAKHRPQRSAPNIRE